jgi:hypothetical protein
MQKMIARKPVELLLVATVSSVIGYAIGSPSQLPKVTLEHVQVTQIHPASLYVREPNGQEKRFPIDYFDSDWARKLADYKGKRCSIELKPSSQCANRYYVSTIVMEPTPGSDTRFNQGIRHAVVFVKAALNAINTGRPFH